MGVQGGRPCETHFQLRNTKQKCFSLSQTSHASFAKDVLMVNYDSVYLQGCDLDSSLLIWHILILTDSKAGVSTVNILTGLTVLAAGCCVFILMSLLQLSLFFFFCCLLLSVSCGLISFAIALTGCVYVLICVSFLATVDLAHILSTMVSTVMLFMPLLIFSSHDGRL